MNILWGYLQTDDQLTILKVSTKQRNASPLRPRQQELLFSIFFFLSIIMHIITSNVNFHDFYMSLYIRRGIWGQIKFYSPKIPQIFFFFHCISWPYTVFLSLEWEKNSSVLSSSMTFFPSPSSWFCPVKPKGTIWKQHKPIKGWEGKRNWQYQIRISFRDLRAPLKAFFILINVVLLSKYQETHRTFNYP